MAIFNTEYFTTLDRGYYSPETMAASKKAGTFAGSFDDFPEVNPIGTALTGREIGTTMAPDTYPVQELNAKIRQGAAKLEIAFSGAGKSGFGGRGSTPEVLGRREREEFRELARINEVEVSTHATFGKQGLSGLTQQGFMEEEAQKTLKEINKAIEFAANATTGGAVVFHAGEWQRPIMDAGIKNPDKVPIEERKFQEYEEERNKAPIYLADPKTGKIQLLNREMKFYFPQYEKDETIGVEFIAKDKEGKPIVEELSYEETVKRVREKHLGDKEFDKKTDAEVVLYGLYEQQLKEAEGTALRFSEGLDDTRKALQKITEQRKMEEKIWDATPEQDRWKLMRRETFGHTGVEGEYVSNAEILRRQEEKLKQSLIGNQSTVTSALEQQKKIMSEMNRFKPIEEVGILRTADTLAKAGIKAMEETERHKKELKYPIYIAPENLFPDFYGSNAEEMINIVEKSREDMAKKLRARGLGRKEAEEKAQEHIRATLDTGHLNEWRQHFKGNEKEYRKWYLDQVQKMVDKKVLGHIHLTDNWGYDDEHLTPGQGNTSTKEVVAMLEKAGFKDFITEVGSFNANTIMPDTLAELGSPVYALGRHMNPIPFGKIRNGHFGYAAPPNYIVGAYSPSNDFKLWSEVPLE